MGEKGGNYERKLCKRFGLWWTQDLDTPRNDIFWRTSQSGGRATQRQKKGVKTAYQYGDMTFTDPIGKPLIDLFLFEFKKGYNDMDVLDIIDSRQKKPLLLKFWDKAEQDRKACGRPYSILIVKRDHKKSFVVIESSLLGILEDHCGVWKDKMLIIKDWGLRLAVLRLDKFLDWLHPDTIGAL